MTCYKSLRLHSGGWVLRPSSSSSAASSLPSHSREGCFMRTLSRQVTTARCARLRQGTRRLSLLLRSIVPFLAIAMLAGCAGVHLPASVSEGTCNIIPRAEYEILGKTRNDQRWIDDTIEGEVGGCGFARPLPRPASWDAKGTTTVTVAPAVATKRPGLVKRTIAKTKALIKRTPVPGTVEPQTPVGPPWNANLSNKTETLPEPAPIIKRDPVDELLDDARPTEAAKPAPHAKKRCNIPLVC